jgi:hypothetical protein
MSAAVWRIGCWEAPSRRQRSSIDIVQIALQETAFLIVAGHLFQVWDRKILISYTSFPVLLFRSLYLLLQLVICDRQHIRDLFGNKVKSTGVPLDIYGVQ